MIRRVVLLDGREVSLEDARPDVAEVEPGVYSVLVDGKSLQVRVVPGEDGMLARVGENRFLAQVRDPRNTSRGSQAGSRQGQQQVRAPMPGKVVKVLVVEGQAVKAGQGVVVVEAMKMQNEMKAAQAGTVTKVAVEDGATVNAGAVLVVIE